MALVAKTPADAAGIQVKGGNKWLTIIQNTNKPKNYAEASSTRWWRHRPRVEPHQPLDFVEILVRGDYFLQVVFSHYRRVETVVGTDLNLVVDFCRFLCVCSVQGVDFDSKGGDCSDLARHLRAETVRSESVRHFDNR